MADPTQAAPYQRRVNDWMQHCFGPVISADGKERNYRFLEEALELVQACGLTRAEAQQLVDYTFDRPEGEAAQEVGGVLVTLAALCTAHGLHMADAGEAELARILQPAVTERIRAKQAAKPHRSPLPGPDDRHPDAEPVATPAMPANACRVCNGQGRQHEDCTDRDKSIYCALAAHDFKRIDTGEMHQWRIVPCRRCKGLKREPKPDEVILTTQELEALPEYHCTMPLRTVVGTQWRKSGSAHDPKHSLDVILRDPGWLRGEYVDHDDPKCIGIEWKDITVFDDTPRVGDVCPECDGRGQVGVGSGQPGVIGMHFEQCFDCGGTGQVRPSMADRLARVRERAPQDDAGPATLAP